ncbi:ankyrin repeat domain-containing protein SOWAHB isoform X1 [Syngnathus scovelli]|uniref:ankyrin repeat domain-containing protein SOWAHB isoform X1 n=1 Tax=Syngnathus scovelli TaxID=161590 RepID=UPI00210F5A8C|nr:ankyrin repeat domain-containing protein SOWAHA isoform X1 [Syngnathus scovelli]
MNTDFTQDSVLHFLQSRGGSVKNSDLLQHFRGFLRDHADQVRNRELFKKFVNSVATVKQEHGVSHVVLRKKFRGSGPSGGSGTPVQRTAEPSPLNPAWSKEKVLQKSLPLKEVAPALPRESNLKNVLPVADLILNNNNRVETNLNLTPEAREFSRDEAAPAVSHDQISAKTHPSPQSSATRQRHPQATVKRGAISQQVPPSGTPKSKEGGHPHHAQQRRTRHRQSYKTAVSYDDEEEDDDEELNVMMSTSGAVGPLRGHLEPLAEYSSSQPIASSSTEWVVPKISVKNIAEGQVPHLESELQPRGPKVGPNVVPVSPIRLTLPAEHSMPSPDRAEDEERRYRRHLEHEHEWRHNERTWLSSSHDSIFSYPSDAGFSSREWAARTSGWNSSTDKLQLLAGASAGAFQTQEVLQQISEAKQASKTHHTELKVTAPWHNSKGNILDKRAFVTHVASFHRSSERLDQQQYVPRGVPWSHSSGDLYDDHESSDCSASSPAPRPTLAGRISGRLRGRMCRSMGADLNELLQEEEAAAAEGRVAGNEAARRKRLHRISSSLSLRYNLSSSSLSSCSTPSRCNSLADLAERTETKEKAGAHQESPCRQSLVPLEPREHAWLVKGASGAWPDIYSLFREDCTLLNRRDFISGFTILHWIAKHGDHRVLNTLWYGVQKAGLAFDINARSSCGHTPLHIAAIQGNKNMIRLLVNKFDADVKLRDTAGKRPWQYLNRSMPYDIFQLLGGTPTRNVERGGASSLAAEGRGKQKPHQRRRHRHLSFASQGEKPRTISGTKVKRSSSIAAFLKHKSLARFHGYKSDD